MSGRGTVQPHGLYLQRFMAMNHRRYIAWFRSTARVVFATWRAADLPPLRTHRLMIPFNRTDSIRGAPGTARRPFPTVSLEGECFTQRFSKTDTSVNNNCQLSIVNFPAFLSVPSGALVAVAQGF